MATPLRVLILEDQPADAELMLHELRRAGFAPVWKRVETEAAYLAHLDQSWDVILADYHLPQFDALRALRHVQECGLAMPFIIVSGNLGEEMAVQCVKHGATDYLLKDRLTRLGQAVGQALEQQCLRNARRQAEQTLRQAEEKYRSIFENAVEGIFQSTPEGHFLTVNPTLVRMVGYASAEALLQGLSDIGQQLSVMTFGQTEFRRRMAACGAVSGFEARLSRQDGSTLWTSVNARAVYDTSGVLRYYEGTLEDITERKQVEEALRASEERTRLILETALDAVVTMDRSGIITGWNPQAERTFGWTRQDAIGRSMAETIIPERFREAHLRGLHHYLATGESAMLNKRIELLAHHHDGHEFPVELAITTLGTREAVTFSAFVRDITAQRHLETQLREAQKMEAIGTLAGGIAHDFNNILQIIIGFTELAQCDVEQASPVWPSLQHVLTAGKRAKELVHQMLTFSRHHAPQRQPLRLPLLIHETLQLLRAALPSTIDIRTFLNTMSGTVLANPTQLQQVLMNLASNADYAMRTTGGVLEVHLDEVDLTPDPVPTSPTLPPGPYLRLTIRDTGVGMTPEVMARMFEPFFTTKGPGEGTGLGLAAVYGIISRHGGTITVASTPGQGTTFTIHLPRVAEAPPVRDRLAEPLPTGTERILFVDDEESLRTLARETFVRLGYEVTVSTSSLDALVAFRSTPLRFDLVITDQTMPAMTGETLGRELRLIRPDIPVILCTGYSPLIDAEHAAVLGIDAFLLKPVAPETLAHTIRQVLTRRKGSEG